MQTVARPEPIETMDLETRLLIVDDDPGIRELTAAFLADHGYVVDVERR